MGAWVTDVQARCGSEGVSSDDDGCFGRDGCEKADRSGHVEAFCAFAVVDSFTVADATKVWGDGESITLNDAGHDVVNHSVVTVTVIERMWMTHHPRHGRSTAAVRTCEVCFEHQSVECLQRNGFHSHAPDGTVHGVSAGDEKLPIKMLNDRLLVRIPQNEGERRSSGGILIPATAQISKRLVWAEVVALGANVRSAEVGDRVLFSPDDRYEVEVGGNDYIMLRERDIHAVAASRIEASTGLYL